MEMQTTKSLIYIWIYIFFSIIFWKKTTFNSNIIAGDNGQYKYLMNTAMVHVDDVARAHIFLLECSTAEGRYICSSEIMTLERMSEFLSERYPEFQIPTLE